MLARRRVLPCIMFFPRLLYRPRARHRGERVFYCSRGKALRGSAPAEAPAEVGCPLPGLVDDAPVLHDEGSLAALELAATRATHRHTRAETDPSASTEDTERGP